MERKDIQQALIKSAIQTISDVGIDNATTRLLATNAGVNEVYIYRIFGGKENLFKEAFTFVDKEFSSALLSFLPMIYNRQYNTETRFKYLFTLIWKYATDDKEQCSFFIRYYYSRFYTNEMSQERQDIYADVLRIFDNAFVGGTDTWWLFNHILDVIFSSAIKVLRNEIPNDKQTEEKIFSLLYAALKSNLRN